MQSTAEFTGFESAHFDAYEARKWSSNRFNLERMRVREQAEALIARVALALGDEAGDLEVTATQDHPTVFNQRRVDAQWVLLTRAAGELSRIQPLLSHERSLQDAFEDPQPQDQQIALAVRVDNDGVLAAVRIDPHAHLDRRNLLGRLRDEAGRAELLSLLSALPPDVVVAVGDDQVPAPQVTGEQLDRWVEQSSQSPTRWTVGRTFVRQDEAVGTSGFADQVAEIAQQLLPIYRFAAWAPENDHVDGVPFLEREAERLAQAPEPTPAASQAPPRPQPERPSTRGGWSYRPDWAMDHTRDLSRQSTPSTPSARARERAAEIAEERAAEAMAAARSWSYSGPVREAPPTPEPTPPPAADRRPPREDRRRDDRGRRDDRRGGRRDDRRAAEGRGGGRRDDRRGGGRRDDRRGGPRTTTVGGQKPVTETSWVESADAATLNDYVRVTAGLMSGKVGKVVELTSKGGYKVALGEGGMVFEVKKDQATKVIEA